jgi:hypothetical protein
MWELRTGSICNERLAALAHGEPSSSVNDMLFVAASTTAPEARTATNTRKNIFQFLHFQFVILSS